MNETTKEILKIWQKSDELAQGNTSLLLQNSDFFSDLCAARMDVCTIAEKMLYNLPVDNISYPKELTRHLKANADKGCRACWLSSFRETNHTECKDKIHEWFDSKSELLMYIELILE